MASIEPPPPLSEAGRLGTSRNLPPPPVRDEGASGYSAAMSVGQTRVVALPHPAPWNLGRARKVLPLPKWVVDGDGYREEEGLAAKDFPVPPGGPADHQVLFSGILLGGKGKMLMEGSKVSRRGMEEA